MDESTFVKQTFKMLYEKRPTHYLLRISFRNILKKANFALLRRASDGLSGWMNNPLLRRLPDNARRKAAKKFLIDGLI